MCGISGKVDKNEKQSEKNIKKGRKSRHNSISPAISENASQLLRGQKQLISWNIDVILLRKKLSPLSFGLLL